MAGKTEYLYFAGKCKWAKLQAPDKFGKWSVVLYPNKDSLARLKTLKLKNPIKTDPKFPEEGEFITLSRPVSKMMRGKVMGFAPPLIIIKNEEGEDMMEPNCLIGNGSDITIQVEYYSYETPTKEKGYAARLSKVRVDNLIPYKPRSDLNEEEADAVSELAKQPEQLF